MSIKNLGAILFLFTISFSLNAQSKLKQSKADIKEGYSNGGSKYHQSQSYTVEENHPGPSGSSFWETDEDENILQTLLFKTIAFVTYYTTIGDYGGEYHLYNNLSKYPFYDKEAGNYTPKNQNSEAVKFWRIDIRNSVLIGFDNVYGNHLELKLRPVKYVFLSSSYRQLAEEYKEGKHSYLSLFNFSLNYDRIRSRYFNLGYSLGCNYLADEVKEASFALGFNYEIFALQHLSLLGDFNWSTRSGATLKTFELGAAYHVNRYKISCGYEHLQIGNPMYNFMTVGVGVYL